MKILITLGFLCLSTLSFAQSGLHPASAANQSLAGAGGISLSGWEAIGINPGAIGQPTGKLYTIGIAPAGGLLGNTNLNIDFYNQFFTGEKVNGEIKPLDLDKGNRKKELLTYFDPENTIFGSGSVLLLAGSMDYPGIGSFALTWAYKADGHGFINDAYFDRLFNGIQPGEKYDLTGLEGRVALRSEIAVNYSRSIDNYIRIPGVSKVTAGGAVKLQNGVWYFGLEKAEHKLSVEKETSNYTHTLNYELQLAGNNFFGNLLDESIPSDDFIFAPSAGFGMGFDLGVTADVFSFPVFISLTDIGWITWDKNATVVSQNETVVFVPRYRNEDSTVVSTFEEDSLKYRYNPVREKKSFTSFLPTALRIGSKMPLAAIPYVNDLLTQYLIPGTFTAYGSYQQGLNTSPGNTFTPQISLGLEWMMNGWLVRTGQAFGAHNGYNWGFGGGYHHPSFRIEAGTAFFHHLFTGDGMTRISFALTSQVFF